MPGTILGTLYQLIHLLLAPIIQGRYYYSAYFTNEATEKQNGKVRSSRSLGLRMIELGFGYK